MRIAIMNPVLHVLFFVVAPPRRMHPHMPQHQFIAVRHNAATTDVAQMSS
jgi:hypothetical protein